MRFVRSLLVAGLVTCTAIAFACQGTIYSSSAAETQQMVSEAGQNCPGGSSFTIVTLFSDGTQTTTSVYVHQF